MLGSFSQPASPAGVINKDPTVSLDETRSPPNYVFKNNEFDKHKNLTNLDPKLKVGLVLELEASFGNIIISVNLCVQGKLTRVKYKNKSIIKGTVAVFSAS